LVLRIFLPYSSLRENLRQMRRVLKVHLPLFEPCATLCLLARLYQ
jgi:hypothetical protein